MYELGCLNLITGERFYLHFNQMWRLRNYVYRCKNSKKIKIISKPNDWNK